jgi:hypothetical protein
VTRPPRVRLSVRRLRQKAYIRFAEARCDACGESCSTPEGWCGWTWSAIRAHVREWAAEHRKEHLPGGRKFTPG